MHCVDACIADMSMQQNNVHNGVMFDFYPGLPHMIKKIITTKYYTHRMRF